MDRLKQYFTNRLDDLIFVELSEDFLGKAGASTYLKDVPVPIKKADLPGFAGGSGMDLASLGERMALVLGCDMEFKYRDSYLQFLASAFDSKLVNIMLNRGSKAADDGHFKDACIEFRAALCVDGDNPAAMLGYARACQDVYLYSEDDEEIGNFKAESVEMFEQVTIKHPNISEGHYYLGYAYVNMGLYTKAKIAWEEFMKLRLAAAGGMEEKAAEQEEYKEIKQRLHQLEEPVRIEEGCNHIIAGRYDEGIEILEKYKEGEYGNWWPMHFYLGAAYRELGRTEEAVESFKAVLKLNAIHQDSMKELAEIYHDLGDIENEQKYRKKLLLVKN